MAKTILEHRTIRSTQLRAADSRAFALVGVAAGYNVPSSAIAYGPNGSFVETVAPGAFSRSLKAGVDVKALFNHDANHVLGRVKNRTLQLTDTAAGLAFRVELNPKSQAHNDLYAAVQSGLIDECSFAFTVPEGGDEWSRDYRKRTLRNVNLLDISVVTYASYPGATSVGARSANGTGAPKHGGIYTLDWKVAIAMRLAELDKQFDETLQKMEGK